MLVVGCVRRPDRVLVPAALHEVGSATVSLHLLEANERARPRYAKAGYAPDGSTRVQLEYEATEIWLVKAPT
jgi:hypothetical protein